MKKTSLKLVISLLGITSTFTIMFIAGCSKDSTPTHIKKYVENVKAQPAKPIEKLPTVKTSIQSAQYAAHTLRNPFKKPVAQEATTDKPDLNRPKEPLEEFPLDSLHMVGNISRNSTQWAIISAPNGLVYPVTEGQHMGKHFGQIVKITADKIKIVENIRIGSRWKKQPITLSLYE